MAGADIFIMYAASSNNVTVSPRLGKGEYEPLYNSAAQITVLEGSGISSDGVMTAYVRCDSCLKWTGGSLDPTTSQSDWIWAIKEGDAIDSAEPTANLVQHNTMGTSSLDLTQAQSTDSSNPFLNASTATSSSSSASSSESSSPGIESLSYPSSLLSLVQNSHFLPSLLGVISSTTLTNSPDLSTRIAHATLMVVSFLFLFPLGALIKYLPIFSTITRITRLHALLQLLALCLMLAGLGLGVSLAKSLGKTSAYHPIIGYIVVASIAIIQPSGGLVSHLHFHRTGSRNALLATTHTWLGRILIILGVINGGLGIRLAGPITGDGDDPTWLESTYIVLAVIIAAIYIFIIVLANFRERRRDVNEGNTFDEAARRTMDMEKNNNMHVADDVSPVISEDGSGAAATHDKSMDDVGRSDEAMLDHAKRMSRMSNYTSNTSRITGAALK